MEKGITYLPLPPSFFFLSLFSVGFFAFDVSALRGQRRRRGRGAVAVRAVANVEGGGGTDGRSGGGLFSFYSSTTAGVRRTDGRFGGEKNETDRPREEEKKMVGTDFCVA